MKKFLLLLMAMFAFGFQNVNAQDAPLKIITNHPDFKIKVKRCAASGKTVVLDLILTNEGVNDIENIEISGGIYGTEAYDDDGNIYQQDAIKVKVANRKEYSGGGTGTFNIPTGVPIRLSLQFSDVSNAAQSIARLKINANCKAWGLNHDKPIKINNIPISRD